MDILPFTIDHLPDAAALLAQRHREQRRTEPLLPARYEEAAGALPAVLAAWENTGTSGAAMFSAGRMVGFVLGSFQTTPVRDRHVWIHFGGHAAVPDIARGVYRRLYASLAQRWVDEGCHYHIVQVPATDREAVEAWVSLGFGHEQVHGLRALHAEVVPPVPNGIEIRRAGPEDLELVMSLAGVIAEHQVLSPVFGVCLPESCEGWRQGYSELLADRTATTWLALEGARPVALQAYEPAAPSESDLMAPPDCYHLEVAATLPEARGRGIGSVLTAIGLDAVRREGAAACLTDWRVTNLISSSFWTSRGFREVVYRLSRRIDPRIAWARGPLRAAGGSRDQ